MVRGENVLNVHTYTPLWQYLMLLTNIPLRLEEGCYYTGFDRFVILAVGTVGR